MSYESNIDIVQILRSTLYLLEHAQYAERQSLTIQAIVPQIRQAIFDLEAAKHPPAGTDDSDERAKLA